MGLEFRDQEKLHSEPPTSSYPTPYTNNIKMNSKRKPIYMYEKWEIAYLAWSLDTKSATRTLGEFHCVTASLFV